MAESDYRSTLPIPVDPIVGIPVPAQTALRVTADCDNRITQPIGCPEGLIQNAVNSGVPTAFSKTPPGIGVPLQLISVISNGTCTIAATCSKPHGLKNKDQISVDGMLAANGFYSVTVISATAFTYQTPNNVAANALLTPTARIITALVGLPYGSDTIPNPGCEIGPQGIPGAGGEFGIVPGGQAVLLPGGQGIILP